MKKVIAVLLTIIFSLSVFACVTRNSSRNSDKLDDARNANTNAQRDMDEAFDE
jgi:hypothetical protein